MPNGPSLNLNIFKNHWYLLHVITSSDCLLNYMRNCADNCANIIPKCHKMVALGTNCRYPKVDYNKLIQAVCFKKLFSTNYKLQTTRVRHHATCTNAKENAPEINI